jgi:HPt (histidine-containing phosphotransfer) domain-containing protein
LQDQHFSFTKRQIVLIVNGDAPIFSLYKDQPIYRDLLQDFVSCLDGRVKKSREAFKAKDWKDLSHLMHQLRGAAATYGYPTLAELAGGVEIASASPSRIESEIAEAIDSIDVTCRKIEAGIALTPA